MRVGKSLTEKEFIRTHQATSVRATFSKILLSHQIRDLTIMTPLKKGQSQEEIGLRGCAGVARTPTYNLPLAIR